MSAASFDPSARLQHLERSRRWRDRGAFHVRRAVSRERPTVTTESGMKPISGPGSVRPVAASITTGQLRRRPGCGKRPRTSNPWDSPLFLIGGGVLVLLLICGATVALILNRRGSDEKLAEARKYRDAGAFAQAISSYRGIRRRLFERRRRGATPGWSWRCVELRQAVEGGQRFSAGAGDRPNRAARIWRVTRVRPAETRRSPARVGGHPAADRQRAGRSGRRQQRSGSRPEARQVGRRRARSCAATRNMSRRSCATTRRWPTSRRSSPA